MQEQIDQGLQHCEACDAFGILTFCGRCGRRFLGHELERRTCAQCRVDVTTEYCPRCGEQVVSEYLRRWERGEVNLEDEGRRARLIVQQMAAHNERLRRDLWPGTHGANAPVDLVKAVNAGFGRPA